MKDYGYRKGDLKLRAEEDGPGLNAAVGDAYLPHSCDEWCIGDLDNVDDMFDDLLEIKKKLMRQKS